MAEEYGNVAARYAFTRDNTAGGLIASYAISMGSTAAGDFSTSLAGTVSFESGSDTVYLDVVPVDDDLQESLESFTVCVAEGGGYTLGTEFEAPGEIQNNQLSMSSDTATLNITKPQQGTQNSNNFNVTTVKNGAPINEPHLPAFVLKNAQNEVVNPLLYSVTRTVDLQNHRYICFVTISSDLAVGAYTLHITSSVNAQVTGTTMTVNVTN